MENRTVRLLAANLQDGRDSAAAAVVLVGAADHSGADPAEVGAAAGQIDLGGLGGAGGTPAAAAVHIVDGGGVADAGDVAAADQGSLGGVHLDAGIADAADAAGGYRDRETGVGAAAAAISAAGATVGAAAAI